MAIERIEVLRDGASAIYGTDAIGGVVNIITRKEYEGISVAGQGTWPSESGGEQYSANILGGFGSLAKQGWNVFGGFTYTKQEALLATDRSYTGTGLILDKGQAKTSGTQLPGQLQPVVNRRVDQPDDCRTASRRVGRCSSLMSTGRTAAATTTRRPSS